MFCVRFETLGCKLNQIETESLANAFVQAGFTILLDRPDAENKHLIGLSVVNTCTVTGKAEQKARRLIRLLLQSHPDAPVLVTGCYAELEAEALAAIDTRICVFPGSKKGHLAHLPSWLAERQLRLPHENLIDALHQFESTCSHTSDTFALSADTFFFHSRASIKIQDGCNNSCTYCRIRLARGKSVSLDAQEVISRVKQIEHSGSHEVILTGVNLSQYRSTDTRDFADLLSGILAETSSISIRISSLYPERVNEALLPLLSNPRVCPHFHLSVQSGSDTILRAMKRPYSVKTIYAAAEGLRQVKENPFLACDIITGFPGETEEDFEATYRMCSEIGFTGIHAFPFSPRPGTEAYTMKPRIPERIAGERVARLTELAKNSYQTYLDYWTGRELSAIVEQSAQSDTSILTENYISARLIGDTDLSRGSLIRVQLEKGQTARLISAE